MVGPLFTSELASGLLGKVICSLIFFFGVPTGSSSLSSSPGGLFLLLGVNEMVVCPLLAILILLLSSGFLPEADNLRTLHSCCSSFRDLSTIEVGLMVLISLLFFTVGRGECRSASSMSFLGVGFDVVPPPLGLAHISLVLEISGMV